MARTADLQGETPNPYLTLSALTEGARQPDPITTEIERQLAAIDGAKSRGDRLEAETRTDQLIGFVFGPQVPNLYTDLVGDETSPPRTTYDPASGTEWPRQIDDVAPITESELRALWGDR